MLAAPIRLCTDRWFLESTLQDRLFNGCFFFFFGSRSESHPLRNQMQCTGNGRKSSFHAITIPVFPSKGSVPLKAPVPPESHPGSENPSPDRSFSHPGYRQKPVSLPSCLRSKAFAFWQTHPRQTPVDVRGRSNDRMAPVRLASVPASSFAPPI